MTNKYEKSGVNIQAGYQVRDEIKKRLVDQDNKNIGNFGGAFSLDVNQFKKPTLISGTDGVGTKLLVAEMAKKYDTVGIDCVAMCVNDVIAQGAKPLYFMDYIASGMTNPEKIKRIIDGILQGCREANIQLIGGETAEMPGMYGNHQFDLAGFTVGIAEQEQLLNIKKIEQNDIVLGFKSNGVHSNGFSLIRKIFFKDHNFQDDRQLLNELLRPTRIYVKEALPLLSENKIKAIAHITGGGFFENIPRILSKKLAVRIDTNSWRRPEIFKKISQLGDIDEHEMFGTFNMGIGLVLIVSKENSIDILNRVPDAVEIGKVVIKKHESVELVGE